MTPRARLQKVRVPCRGRLVLFREKTELSDCAKAYIHDFKEHEKGARELRPRAPLQRDMRAGACVAILAAASAFEEAGAHARTIMTGCTYSTHT